MNPAEVGTDVILKLLKVLSKPDAFEIFLLAVDGIENSTHAIEELGFTPKRYYARMRELVDMGFLRKTGGVYRQTPFGSMIHSRLIPAMGRAYDARDRLGLIEEFRGTDIEDEVRNFIEEKINISNFVEYTKVNVIGDYEALVIDLIDMCDEAKENIILASNYFDVRVMEATFRSMDRGVANRVIGGKNSLSSKLQQLKLIFSTTIIKKIINLASNDITNVVKFSDLTYSFCVVDGHLNLIILPNAINDNFMVAFIIDDKDLGDMLTEHFEEIWKIGEFHPAFKFLDSLKRT